MPCEEVLKRIISTRSLCHWTIAYNNLYVICKLIMFRGSPWSTCLRETKESISWLLHNDLTKPPAPAKKNSLTLLFIKSWHKEFVVLWMFYKRGLSIFYHWKNLSFFFEFHGREKGGRWLMFWNINTCSVKLLEPTVFFVSHWVVPHVDNKTKCRSRSEPKAPLNQQDCLNRRFMPLDQTMI